MGASSGLYVESNLGALAVGVGGTSSNFPAGLNPTAILLILKEKSRGMKK